MSVVLEDELVRIIKSCKINFSKLMVQPDSGVNLNFDFPIKPNDFLRFAKQDLRSKDTRGKINAITNAKRAIDCQTDKIFKLFDIPVGKLPKAAEDYIKGSVNIAGTQSRASLRVIEALALTPVTVVSKMRSLRNKLEHFYEIPTDEEIQESLDIAVLFIDASSYKTKMLWEFYFGDQNSDKDISVVYHPEEYCFDISADFDAIKLTSVDNLYYYFLKIALAIDKNDDDVEEGFKELLSYLNYPVPIKSVKLIT